MKPLLAHTYEPRRVTYPCYVQPKLNGVRALYQNGSFQSRDEQVWDKKLLRHLSEPLLEIFPPHVILDGELYVHGWSLQRINGAVTPVRKSEKEDTAKVEYHVFDVVEYGKSFEERHQSEERAGFFYNTQMGWAIPDLVNWVETVKVFTEQAANDNYISCVSLGYEGMMYRLGDCPYTVPKQRVHYEGNQVYVAPGTNNRTKFLSDKNNRCWHLLKRKDWQDDEFLFESLNTTVGEKGERGFQMWLLAPRSKTGRFKVSSGLSDSELDYYLENPPIGRQVKVKYLVLSEDNIPLNATILAIL